MPNARTALIPSILVATAFCFLSHTGQGMQLSKGAGDFLEAVLGSGNNVLLKLNMDISSLKDPLTIDQLDQGPVDVPVRLFLTDFMSAPTAHPSVELTKEVEGDPTATSLILPPKPVSFGSHAQFTDWIKKGRFSNQVKVSYSFSIDLQASAPALAACLFAVAPAYQFAGTYTLVNDGIQPAVCTPQVTYDSKRSDVNKTTITLGGTLYFNNNPYPISDHVQTFPHPIISQVTFKKDKTKQFYSRNWIARSEATAKVTYEEFPNHLIKNWPKAPTGTYSILKKTPDDFEDVKHLGCWDGASGNEVDISDGRAFVMDCEAINASDLNAKFTESIVKDDGGSLYTVHYVSINPKPSVPPVAIGHEEVYLRFLNGALIYTDPQTKSKITLPIRELANPLEGTFDLSKCGNTGNYLSISTGYRKAKKPENASKVEIWITPRFLVEKEINTTADHLYSIYATWRPTADVGLLWNWGGWDNIGSYDYLTHMLSQNLSGRDLYSLCEAASPWGSHASAERGAWRRIGRCNFHVSFLS